jgi:PRTRC genetic system protein C
MAGKRIFMYDGKPIDDPDPAMSIEEVRQFLANVFWELYNATSTEKKDGEDTVITFAKRVGTKGAAEEFQAGDILKFHDSAPFSKSMKLKLRMKIIRLLSGEDLYGRRLILAERLDLKSHARQRWSQGYFIKVD